jgi:hypothetical protein
MDNALVVSNKEVEAGIAGMGSKRFYQLFRYRQDRDISNGDGVERAEVVYDTEGTSVVFDYTEPSGTVSSVGWFIRTRHYFVMDNLDEFVVQTWWDGDILVDPWRMRNRQDADWGEEILAELSFFLFNPR